MLSSPSYPAHGGDSAMPGNYESFTRLTPGNAPFSSPSSGPRPIVPGGRTPFPQIYPASSPGRTPFPQYPPAPPPPPPPGRTPFPMIPPYGGGPPMRRRPIMPRQRRSRHHRRRRRSCTPKIVIEERGRRSSCGRRRVVRVPLDPCPTLGLRGPPKRVLEIERVRCRRRRRCRPVCYHYDCEQPVLPTQPTTIIANPIPNPCIQAVQSPLIIPSTSFAAAAPSTGVLNLTPQMIENLPKQTVHLPPIHLPGSRADANTELETVVFPAEIINPFNGTLSILQANPGVNTVAPSNIQPIIPAPVQSQLISRPTTVGIPITPRGLPVSPAMASDPVMQRFQQIFQRLRFPPTRSISQVPSPPIIRPTLPNISSMAPMNNITNAPPIISLNDTPNVRSYLSTNIPSANPLNAGYYRPASTGPIISSNITPYRPANITPYRPSTFTPSPLASNPTYRPTSIPPASSSENGPYRSANITPYVNMADRSTNNPLSQSVISSEPIPYTSTASIASSRPFSTFDPFASPSTSGVVNNYINSESFPSTPYQSNDSMPKSILRNGTSTNTSYTRLMPPNVLSSNDKVNKTARLA
ncbi:unnamed protein product [Rotaria sp. Silwood2]|nr:unnamed protein product [Rotaria sp. Silwood2]CAF4407659.1 unnamed protein product [Rotaria sp. Silwood2]